MAMPIAVVVAAIAGGTDSWQIMATKRTDTNPQHPITRT
jgi:hypothetical protein